MSGATSSAEQAARQKATDLAVQAFRSEVCSLTEDGRLSSSEVSKLRGALDTATAAGLPAQVVEQVRPLVEQSSSATKAQVKRLRAGVCTG